MWLMKNTTSTYNGGIRPHVGWLKIFIMYNSLSFDKKFPLYRFHYSTFTSTCVLYTPLPIIKSLFIKYEQIRRCGLYILYRSKWTNMSKRGRMHIIIYTVNFLCFNWLDCVRTNTWQMTANLKYNAPQCTQCLQVNSTTPPCYI